MKKINVLAATAIVALGIAATSCDSKPSANLKSAVDSASYAIGVSTGAGYKENAYGDGHTDCREGRV